jgi:hypothetical protein
MAGVESLRGSQEDPEKRKYPGGAFDPAGLAKVHSLLHAGTQNEPPLSQLPCAC